MDVEGIQFFFHLFARFQDFRLAEHKVSALLMTQLGNEPHIFGGLFGSYFLQIFDLRGLKLVHRVFYYF